MQGTPLQQSPVAVQICPNCAQVVLASEPGGGATAPHVPLVEPERTTQLKPLQQSAVTVHGPVLGLHVPPSDGAPHLRAPLGSGKHGAPLQQSPLNAHVSPMFRHLPPKQRGTPTASRMHSPPIAPRAVQQSARAEESLHA
jgi:hypothetical protein